MVTEERRRKRAETQVEPGGKEGGREKERALETSVHRQEGARRVEGEKGGARTNH